MRTLRRLITSLVIDAAMMGGVIWGYYGGPAEYERAAVFALWAISAVALVAALVLPSVAEKNPQRVLGNQNPKWLRGLNHILTGLMILGLAWCGYLWLASFKLFVWMIAVGCIGSAIETAEAAEKQEAS